jgi:integrating conjugative element protein (TIGR03746 family)
MSKFVDALQQSKAENRRLFYLCLILAATAAGAMWGWKTAPNSMTVHVPPDLRNGATLKGGITPEVPDTTVYTFAFYIWQQVNRWQADGSKDYGDQIYSLQSFLTPGCREQLIADMNQRNNAGELARRTRAVMEIPGLGYVPERVLIGGANTWKVLLDAQLQETQGLVSVKDTFIRYPLRVVRYDIDREKNPWQLAIDCFGGERPARLDAKAVAVAKTGRTVAEIRTEPLVPINVSLTSTSTSTSTSASATAAAAVATPAASTLPVVPEGAAPGVPLPIAPATLPKAPN